MVDQSRELGTTPSERPFPAVVARLIDEFTLVINRGSDDGVRMGQQFLVYGIADEVEDPETGESLGQLEVVRGRGEVVHVQSRMATLRCSEKAGAKVITRRNLGGAGILSALGREIVEERDGGQIRPFEDAVAGDCAKRL